MSPPGAGVQIKTLFEASGGVRSGRRYLETPPVHCELSGGEH
jgi:hypothetical protein